MLPLQLLRVRTKKGDIIPLFCTDDTEVQLAKELISEFTRSASNREQRKQLRQRLESIESQYDDFKLVRGLSALLERRCEFTTEIRSNRSNVPDRSDSDDGNKRTETVDPVLIRRALFEESSREGFALTDFERERIIANVASSMKLSASFIKEAMWSDLEDNMFLRRFDSIAPPQLLSWYNLSLMQTLLFNCTRLEFSLHGGLNWKRVLRNVRRLGLMYNLEKKPSKDLYPNQDRAPKHTDGGANSMKESKHDDNASSPEDSDLMCSIDGPLSIFKLTEKYGTSIAKLVPTIISTEKWSMSASIVRKTMSGKKIYQFRISSHEAPALMGHPSQDSLISPGFYPDSDSNSDYDSTVEEKFANRFLQSSNGWRLVREPDPIIVSGGRAFIPDFMFEKYGKKVYLEIVGFWTREYLERKLRKLVDIISGNTIDLFVALNENLACSKIGSFPTSSIPGDRIIYYKNDSVPSKVITDYLSNIDKQLIEKQIADPSLKIRFDHTKDVVSLREIAAVKNIPLESAVRIAERDNPDEYLIAGEYFISRKKAKMLAELLKEAIKLSDANQILSQNSVPEACHTELVSKLGYDIVWKNIDPSSAVLTRRQQ